MRVIIARSRPTRGSKEKGGEMFEKIRIARHLPKYADAVVAAGTGQPSSHRMTVTTVTQ
jgi:hypothetical protein